MEQAVESIDGTGFELCSERTLMARFCIDHYHSEYHAMM
jgi:hypothetical protein